MIKLKELENRIYDGRECERFEYVVRDTENDWECAGNDKMLIARFERLYDNTWKMTIVLDRTRDADSQVYCFTYTMPIATCPLELIAATGLRFFQLYLKEEIQRKTAIDFTLGTVLEGM